MQMDRIAIGKQTEQLACRYLQKNGLTHKESNYRCRQGEIDLVMEDGNTLVFVEVRYRKSSRFGSAAESIDNRKQNKLALCAKHYLAARNKLNQSCRFDVISMNGPLAAIRIEWIPNAFIT
jgi:putative endonuclease